jgi:hypothetical protein
MYSGILLAASAESIEHSLGLALLNSAAVTAVILIWRWMTRKRSFDLTELLPSGKGIIPVSILLTLVYLFFGFNLSMDALPGPIGHISVILLYILFILLIRRSVRMDMDRLPPLNSAAREDTRRFRLKHWLLFCAAFILSAAFLNLLPFAVRELMTGIVFISGIFMGVLFFVRSVRALFRSGVPAAPSRGDSGENTL